VRKSAGERVMLATLFLLLCVIFAIGDLGEMRGWW
jgi:hypothetical protein